MSKTKVLLAVLALILILAGYGFYNVVFNGEASDFKEGIEMPQAIVIFQKQINDPVIVKTIMMEIEKSPLERATKRDMQDIDDSERAFSIGAVYKDEDSNSGRLGAIEVLKDGTFIASKIVNGREQYAKGRFNQYTLDFLTGLYTLD